MGHDKLRKFAENETFGCLLQPSSAELLRDGFFNIADHPIKGCWSRDMFGGNDNPIVLELGCGKGEYTIALAERNPGINYIGVDIKGARLWKGAKYATEHSMPNVAFLRTRIEFINAFFAPGEISEIWLTFSDPQMHSENSRLTSPLFLERYRRFLKPGGVIHLKTDSRFLHEYTVAVCRANGLAVQACTVDLYSDFSGQFPATENVSLCSTPPSPEAGPLPLTVPRAARFPGQGTATENVSLRSTPPSPEAGPLPLTVPRAARFSCGSSCPEDSLSRQFGPELFEVRTFYEKMFLEQGYKITYLRFVIDRDGKYVYPDFDEKYWREQEGPRRSFCHAPAKNK